MSGLTLGANAIESHQLSSLTVNDLLILEKNHERLNAQHDAQDIFTSRYASNHFSNTLSSKTAYPGHALYCDSENCKHQTKAFSTISELKKHQRSHIPPNRRPHRCSQCGKTFLWPKDLKRHMSIHLLVRFACHVCKKNYSREDNLERHKSKVHGIEPGLGSPRFPQKPARRPLNVYGSTKSSATLVSENTVPNSSFPQSPNLETLEMQINLNGRSLWTGSVTNRGVLASQKLAQSAHHTSQGYQMSKHQTAQANCIPGETWTLPSLPRSDESVADEHDQRTQISGITTGVGAQFDAGMSDQYLAASIVSNDSHIGSQIMDSERIPSTQIYFNEDEACRVTRLENDNSRLRQRINELEQLVVQDISHRIGFSDQDGSTPEVTASSLPEPQSQLSSSKSGIPPADIRDERPSRHNVEAIIGSGPITHLLDWSTNAFEHSQAGSGSDILAEFARNIPEMDVPGPGLAHPHEEPWSGENSLWMYNLEMRL